MGTSQTLRSVIDAGRTSKRLDELSTARVIGKVAEQLHAMQQKAGAGKAVGPLTPAAIAIDVDGNVKIELAQRGSMLPYSAPEQLDGTGDRRSDVFSLGVVMWEALTHQRLFDAMNDAAVKVAIKEREIKPPAEMNANIPAELSVMCMKALARTPSDRYGSAKVLAVEIEEFLTEAGYYEDSSASLVGFMAEMGKPKASLPPPSILRATPPKGSPVTPKPPEPAPSPGAALASALAKAETKPVAPVAAAQPSPLASSLPPIETVGSYAPPVEPAKPATPQSLKATILAAAPPPVAAAPQTETTLRDLPRLDVPEPAKAEPALEAPKYEAPKPELQKVSLAKTDAVPEKVTGTGSAPARAPNPADAVSLPRRAHRDSEQVLNNWAWQTDSHDALTTDDEDFHPPPSRKPLLYAIGGGVAVAAIVTIIAVGFGGSSSSTPPPQAAAKQTAETPPPPPAPPPQQPAAAPAPAPEQPAAPGSAAEQPPGSAAVAAAPAPPPPPAPAPEPPKQEPPPPPPPPVVAKAEPPKPAPPPPPPPPKADKPKVEKPKVADKPKAETPKPKTVAKAEPPPKAAPAPEKPKVDVETAYRQGLQQFARGDTQGALASLRTSLAGNPNYPPTWRGLGLVFEKLGEKDQARAAYKRYLQLAPSAGDAEQIRGRMERLGS